MKEYGNTSVVVNNLLKKTAKREEIAEEPRKSKLVEYDRTPPKKIQWRNEADVKI
jgi:hypothetical protein